MTTLDQLSFDISGSLSNPYVYSDIDVIISRYEDPTVPSLSTRQDALGREVEGQKNDETSMSDKYILIDDSVGRAIDGSSTLTGVISQINGAGADVAAAYDNYDKKQGEALAWVRNLYNYGSADHPETTNIDLGFGGEKGTLRGVSIQNTVNTIYDAKDARDVAKAILADCIPCKDRIMALLALNPLKDLMGILDVWYTGAIKGLIEGFDLFFGDKSNEVFADICELLKFLNFMCLPDLFGLVFMIQSLIQEYTWEWKDIRITFFSLLGKMMTPTLTPLIGLIDRYIQLAIMPIECVLDALDAQIQKLDLVQLVDVVKNGKTKRQPTPNIMKNLKSGLVRFRDTVSKALKVADEKTKFLHKSLLEILNLEDETNDHLFDLSQHIQQATKFIMLIQAVIRFLQRGFIVCGPEATTDDSVAFFNQLGQGLGQGFDDRDFVVRSDDGITGPPGSGPSGSGQTSSGSTNTGGGGLGSSPSANTVVEVKTKISPELASLYKSLTNYLQATVPQATGMPQTTVNQKLQGTVVIPLRNCLYSVRDKELDNVKDFLGSFEKEI